MLFSRKVFFYTCLCYKTNYAKEKILQYNRDNPKSGYCHLANVPINQESTIKNCLTNDCKCGTDNYSDCRIKGKNFCSEDKFILYLSYTLKRYKKYIVF